MTRDEHDTAPSPIVRDLLLASSGELPWWKRVGLRLRVRSDLQARHVAEAISLLELTAPAPAQQPGSAPKRLIVAGSSIGAVAGLSVIFALVLNRQPAIQGATDEPLSESSRRLVIQTIVTAPSRSATTLEIDPRPFGDGANPARAVLPPWSSWLATEQRTPENSG